MSSGRSFSQTARNPLRMCLRSCARVGSLGGARQAGTAGARPRGALEHAENDDTATHVRLFDLDIHAEGEVVHAGLSGEIDLSTVGEVQGQLDEALAAGPGLLLLDMREVTFLDSSGLRMLLGLNRRQREQGKRLVLAPGRRVARVLELTGAGRELETVEDPGQVSRE